MKITICVLSNRPQTWQLSVIDCIPTPTPDSPNNSRNTTCSRVTAVHMLHTPVRNAHGVARLENHPAQKLFVPIDAIHNVSTCQCLQKWIWTIMIKILKLGLYSETIVITASERTVIYTDIESPNFPGKQRVCFSNLTCVHAGHGRPPKSIHSFIKHAVLNFGSVSASSTCSRGESSTFRFALHHAVLSASVYEFLCQRYLGCVHPEQSFK